MSAFLAANVHYQLRTEHGEPLRSVEGFQCGLFAISRAQVGELEGWPLERGWCVDHWPTGVTVAFFREHVDALWFVDELNIALAMVELEPKTFDELRCAAKAFCEWTAQAMEALNNGKKVHSVRELERDKESEGTDGN